MPSFNLSVIATLVLLSLPAPSFGDEKNHHLPLYRDLQETEIPPHKGCELMLKDKQDPMPMLVGKDFEAITTTDYRVEDEAGSTAAECRNGMAGGYPCKNVDLLSMIPLADLSKKIGGSTQEANDVWGWTDPVSKREFALIGMRRGTAFVEITDPVNPIYLGGLPTQGSGSSWRDIKTLGNFAVIVSEEGGHGMQIFDLKELLTVTSPQTFTNTARYTQIGSAHNVFVNEDSGFAYIVGQVPCSGGLHMVDLKDPRNPTYAGCYAADGYTHDVQCVMYKGPDTDYTGKEICFASNEDTVTIVDVTDKSNPVQISKRGYGASYTHQGWLTEDHSHFIFNDELDEYYGTVDKTSTHIMDVRSLRNPIYGGNWKGRTKAIDHNNYVLGDHIYQANYQAGLSILKMKNVATADFEETGYFDIYPSSNNNRFNGAWSNYPYFPSGTIVVSGIEQGLFMLKYNNPNNPPPTAPPPTTPPPTTPPTSCIDSKAWFVFTNKKGQTSKKSCKWVKNKKPGLCNKVKIQKFCPQTCGACEYECFNANKIEFYATWKATRKWTCKELSLLDRKKKNYWCTNKDGIATTCRGICKHCG